MIDDNDTNIYDLIIIGAGPAGCSCAIYSKKYNLKTLVISPDIGGTMSQAHKVDNYIGILPQSGMNISQEFKKHLDYFEIPTDTNLVKKIEKKADLFNVLTNKSEYLTKKILIGVGLERKKLGVKGEKELFGRGVSYCVTCDAFFYKDKVVGVIGSDDHAATGAIHLAENSSEVYLINSKPELDCKPQWLLQIESNPKIKVLNSTKVEEILGENKLIGIRTNNGEISLDGFFIEIGSVPPSALFSEMHLQKDNANFIVVDEKQRTSISGVYAAGDITTNSDKFLQIVTAASEGAIAAKNIYQDIKKGI